jgi:desampylase
MRVTISSTVVGQIRAEVARSPDVEVCGLLLGAPDNVSACLPAMNVADDPSRTFEVDPRILFAAHRAARAGALPVVGHYHSHPGGRCEPSATDAAMMGADGELWLIATTEDLRGWRASGGAFVPVTLVYGEANRQSD